MQDVCQLAVNLTPAQVRAVLLPEPSFAITASRDGTTRIWKETASSPPTYDSTETSTGAQFKTCLAFLPARKEYPDGLIFSGGQDAIIEARTPDKTAEVNADGLLIGHAHQVCSLDINAKAGYIVSGSWDKTARLWAVGSYEPQIELQGHTAAVWAVLAYDESTIVTGCADKGIRVFDTNGKLQVSFDGRDIVRALVKLPDGAHGDFASASNDGVIRIWTMKGDLVTALHGHESFIYSLAILPTGEIVSSGEDRSVRIWRNNECIQVITLPAISVWSVAVSPEGDIIAGSSDKQARIFTRDSSRQAEPAALAEFDDSIKASTIPKQQLDNVNTTDLPGPEFLQQKSGTKEGQTQLIREANGVTSVHEWSIQQNEWVKIGEVVDSAGSSSSKQQYLGQEYDYVFDVNISDDRPNLKLPFNVSQNPYDAATKFIQDNEVPMDHLEEVANFIIKNTQGVSLGAPQESGPDAWGTENRYRPGQQEQSSYKSPQTQSVPSLPVSTYQRLAAGSRPSLAFQQIKKLNPDHEEIQQLSPLQMESVKKLADILAKHNFESGQLLDPLPFIAEAASALLTVATKWAPPARGIAGLDLLRLLPVAFRTLPPDFAGKLENGADPLRFLFSHTQAFEREFLQSNTKVAMMTLRLMVNLLASPTESRSLVVANRDAIFSKLDIAIDFVTSDQMYATALSTFYLNFAVFMLKEGHKIADDREEVHLAVCLALKKILTSLPASDNRPDAHPLAKSSEAAYRTFMALGTIIVANSEPNSMVVALAKEEDVVNFPQLEKDMQQKGWLKEPRFRKAMHEVCKVLGL